MKITIKRNAPNMQSSRKRRAVNMGNTVEEESNNTAIPQKFVIGVDFGTTFTSVSYFTHPINDQHPRAFPEQLLSIKNWPDDLSSGDAHETLTCEELIYVSDEAKYSHYPLDHEYNKVLNFAFSLSTPVKPSCTTLIIVASFSSSVHSFLSLTHECNHFLYYTDVQSLDVQIAGRIEFDMTFLRKENKIQLIEGEYGSISKAKPHYRVELEISAELNGMLLEYSAKWTGPGGKIVSKETGLCFCRVCARMYVR
ncbi:70d27cb5-d127-4be3-af72-ae3452882fb0-CDS [Sclerotinia trifoliorum]|uniref:70d27cb5-d127-4be3-af72-ae3452882fb0-CDS n=1 Tax=Sclerotinia trifoliorum TaxID=28548 RepID=A0A8H2VT68_9HELO|nr:70d27cb5-d127-4be3-af72-ae3452882fb0-CDS [Sclerotinia trifoliorum]